MANRIYIASSISVIGINGNNQAFLMGLVDNVRLEKTYVTEGVIEIGSYQYADILQHGYGARFSWGQAYHAGDDLISKGFVPDDRYIAQQLPIFLRLVDQLSERLIAVIHKGVVETYTVELNGRAKLMSNVSGMACSLLSESELN